MARRMRKAEAEALAWLIVLGIPIAIGIYLFSALGPWLSVGLVGGSVGLFAWWNHHQTEQRRAALMDKYGDPEIVERIMSGQVWVGQSEEQLLDSRGSPHARDERVLKTKVKETWKYDHQGANRYNFRVTVENGEVVGWDQKS